MTKGQMIEYELVTRAVKATDTEGTSLRVSHFLQEMRERLGEVERADVVDALKRLFLDKLLGLRKWDNPNMRFRNYEEDSDDNLFFLDYHYDLRIYRTPSSRSYLEQYEPPPIDPPKRPIGFVSDD